MVLAAVKAAAVQDQLREITLEDGLENHSTQGSHGVNYHHPEQGNTGYQFFMPSCACLPAWAVMLQGLQHLNPITSYRSELHGQELIGGGKSADQRSGPDKGFDCHRCSELPGRLPAPILKRRAQSL
ncbi:hypothetical protein ABBQ38_012505 [Trebouxia sp. C0009 RCD-2024]